MGVAVRVAVRVAVGMAVRVAVRVAVRIMRVTVDLIVRLIMRMAMRMVVVVMRVFCGLIMMTMCNGRNLPYHGGRTRNISRRWSIPPLTIW